MILYSKIGQHASFILGKSHSNNIINNSKIILKSYFVFKFVQYVMNYHEWSFISQLLLCVVLVNI